MRDKRWEITEGDLRLARELADGLGIEMITAQILLNRGIRTIQQAESFFALNLENLGDPYQFCQMEKAIDRLLAGFAQAEKIVIFGDYDVDGITGTSLLYKVFGQLSSSIDYYIPHRSEGYGLNTDIVQHLADSGYTLIVTIDNGISSLEEVRLANSLGMDVIITDHHEPPENLPAAWAIINPKLEDSGYPFSLLSGVGVGFKLCQALVEKIQQPELTDLVNQQLDLVALGTVADIVPLLGENRIIVALGLQQMLTTANLGLQSLLQLAKLQDKEINTGHLGYLLGPRVNAIGRLDNPMLGVELFTTTQLTKATELATRLDQANRKRQLIEEHILEQAIEMIENADLDRGSGIVLASEEWHPGVIGIVASKLVEKYYRPTILIALQNGIGKGSARGIKGLNLHQAFTHCHRYLLDFGGHEMAAGLTIAPDKIDEFSLAFQDFAHKNLAPEDFIPYLSIDLEVDLSDLNFALLAEVERLKPHGLGNSRPVFVVRQVAHQARIVGSTGEHLRIKAYQSRHQVTGIGFGLAPKEKVLKKSKKIDIAFTLNRNLWQDREYLQMNVLDLVETELDLGRSADSIKIADQRNLGERDEYLKKLLQSGEKTVIFINTLETGHQLTHRLKEKSLKIVNQLAVYHSRLTAEKTQKIKQAWQAGRLTGLIIMDSSDIGEKISDIQHVVHYDLPHNLRQFRQRSEVNKDLDVKIHLLYGDQDKECQQIDLEAKNPNRAFLAQVYRVLHQLADQQGLISTPIIEIIDQLERDDEIIYKPLGIINALRIFQELNLLELRVANFLDSPPELASWQGRLLPRPARKLDLNSSIRYNEGIKERDEFTAFADLALHGEINKLIKLIRTAVS